MIKPSIFYYDKSNVYLNRLDAVRSNNPCSFYYHDDVFASLDWSKEPTESLSEVYRQRAQQIRDDYDHVVICYSGGIDSTNILETFYYNNIHIDEILVVGAISQDSVSGSDENHNGDLYHNVFPTLNSMDLSRTKISIVDYTTYFRDVNNFSLVKQYGHEFVEHIGIRTSVHNLFWYDMDKFLSHSRKTAYVMGKEKPILKYNGLVGKYYAAFHDISYTDYGNRYEYGDGRRINFYSEPGAFKVMLKQYYMIKERHQYMLSKPDKEGVDIFGSYIENIKGIIYNLRNPLVHRSLKSKSTYLSARDMFMVNSTGSEIYNLYAAGIRKINDSNVDVAKKVVFESRAYYLD